MAVISERQREGAREKTRAGRAEVVCQHRGGTAIALAGELQLLNPTKR